MWVSRAFFKSTCVSSCPLPVFVTIVQALTAQPPPTDSLAAIARAGRAAVRAIAAAPIRLRRNNFVERPWGGMRMLDYKGCAPLPDQKALTGLGVGEAFETAACDSDGESREHPSIACLPDGSQIPLPELLELAGPQILGPELHARHGGEIPLLPKTLDIAELLSVQAHPPGNTELYVILDAEPGASIRLGFRHSVDAGSLQRELERGIARQHELAGLLRADANLSQFNDALQAVLGDRDATTTEMRSALEPWLANDADVDRAVALCDGLQDVYWHVLDLMNEVVVRPGQVIYNATPARIRAATGAPPGAEVHALGNPERREILMLEIRRPGVTYRAWDNVRFPVRETDIATTLAALNLNATGPEEFDITPTDEKPLCTLVESDAFVVEQLRPTRGHPVKIAGGRFATLHVIDGEAQVAAGEGRLALGRGESALLPAAAGSARVEAHKGATLIVVRVP